MRVVMALLLLLTGFGLPARAISKRKRCAQACEGLIAACVDRNQDLGDFGRSCKSVLLKGCKKAGPEACVTTTTSSTTSTTLRFVDNGDGTVTDNATGLQWEKKSGVGGGESPLDPHDVDNVYSWSLGSNFPDGDVFTSFLGRLNECVKSSDEAAVTGGFAGHCDWRLPSVSELETILLGSYPCETLPCIDPVFGPTVESDYWSSTHSALGLGDADAWVISFGSGNVDYVGKDFGLHYARGVRRAE